MWFEKPSQKLTENITERTPQRDNMAYGSHQGDENWAKILGKWHAGGLTSILWKTKGVNPG